MRCFYFVLLPAQKTVETIPQPAYNPLVGSWYLYNTSVYDNKGWYQYDAGLYGNLSFYQNGVAQYDDNNTFLQGSWNVANSYDGYYDYNAYYHNNLHQNLSVNVSDGSNHAVNLYFDNVSFDNNNQFYGTYYTGTQLQVFTFRRVN